MASASCNRSARHGRAARSELTFLWDRASQAELVPVEVGDLTRKPHLANHFS
jgi:hypothetical protein